MPRTPPLGAAADFPPHVLREYALLADGERGALVGPRGDVAWMCAPGWDCDAVFSCLIGGRGVYAVTPDRTRFVWGGYYEDGSLIWRSRWVTATGFTECREALAYPGDPDTAVVLRRVRGGGRPGPGQGRAGPAGRLRAVPDEPAQVGRRDLDRAQRAAPDALVGRRPGARVRPDGALELHLALDAGQQHDLVLELSSRPLPRRPADPGRRLAGHRAGLGGRRAQAGREPGPGGQPAQLRRAGRADQPQRGHGRRRHHVAAGTLPGRPQLRLPLRVDPGPVLRRPGGGRRRAAPAAGRRGRLRGRAGPGRRARS